MTKAKKPKPSVADLAAFGLAPKGASENESVGVVNDPRIGHAADPHRYTERVEMKVLCIPMRLEIEGAHITQGWCTFQVPGTEVQQVKDLVEDPAALAAAKAHLERENRTWVASGKTLETSPHSVAKSFRETYTGPDAPRDMKPLLYAEVMRTGIAPPMSADDKRAAMIAREGAKAVAADARKSLATPKG
ncbi:MAG: hypothetical protein GY944_29580 [bacterium]|nr:hypothetical protein [bacterium]